MFIKLATLPFLLLLPFSFFWLNTTNDWRLPFIVWTICILINAAVEWVRAWRSNV